MPCAIHCVPAGLRVPSTTHAVNPQIPPTRLIFWNTSGALHTEDEEASLFPRLRQKLAASDLEFIDSLEAQHIEAGALFSKLKEVVLELELPRESSVDPLARNIALTGFCRSRSE